MAGYSGKALDQKLGIKAGQAVLIIGAPDGFVRGLALPPESNILLPEEKDKADYLHFFTQSLELLASKFPLLKSRMKSESMLWISWPKKTSGIKTDLNENLIRDLGLQNGLVDVKVCAIDDTWSALKFVYRLKDRKK